MPFRLALEIDPAADETSSLQLALGQQGSQGMLRTAYGGKHPFPGAFEPKPLPGRIG